MTTVTEACAAGEIELIEPIHQCISRSGYDLGRDAY